MSRLSALAFASAGVICLLAVSLALSFQKPWLVLLSLAAFIGCMGWGFATKAKARKKS